MAISAERNNYCYLLRGCYSNNKQATKESPVDHDTVPHIVDLAAKGSTIAIAAFEDPIYDFYLIKVTS